jgi:hypothetical protein
MRFLTGEVSNYEPQYLNVTTFEHPKLPVARAQVQEVVTDTPERAFNNF